jgi:membrane protease YdiL (CAAX protease family)
MKRSYVNVGLLLVVLMLNIIFTQYMVHQYFFEHYSNSLIAAVINIILFAVAFFVYKWDKRSMEGATHDE